MLRASCLVACLCGLLLSVVATVTRSAPPNETTTLDCGVNALFVLLRLEGCGATLDRIETFLPRANPRGYSMAELTEAAGKLGLRLEGVQFEEARKPLRRPAIVFVQGDGGGHFAVLRPVGSTGTMVQVIDPPNIPWITDYDRLFADPSWTGRVLIASEPWSVRWGPAALAGIIVTSLLLPVLSRLTKRFHRTRDVPPAAFGRGDVQATEPPARAGAGPGPPGR